MVAKFLGQTKDVIEYLSGNGNKEIDFYLILCDTVIGQEFHITSLEEFPRLDELRITGGGTDFIPVFERIEELIEKGGDNGNTALFYYTDGCGRFPDRKPSFDTYFLMEEQDLECFEGPPWIETITI
jgi:predicted metal-dependent peptidase